MPKIPFEDLPPPTSGEGFPLHFETPSMPGTDVTVLEVGEALDFAPMGLTAPPTENPIRYVNDWKGTGGVILAVHVKGEELHRIEGTAVMVGPGIALCASHVIEEHRAAIRKDSVAIYCVGYTASCESIWVMTFVRFVPNTDVCILSLSLMKGVPVDRRFNFAPMTTRTPHSGERLFLFGFVALKEDCETFVQGKPIRSSLFQCTGKVTHHYLEGRDTVMLPGPSVEVDCPTLSGMSGGPAFDSEGWLVGTLSTSLTGEGPSYLSTCVSALACRFVGGWPAPPQNLTRSLLAMNDHGTYLERPSCITATYETDESGRQHTSYVYNTWTHRK